MAASLVFSFTAIAIPAQTAATAFGRGRIWGTDAGGRYHRFLSNPENGQVLERIDNGPLLPLSGVVSPSAPSAANDSTTLALAIRGADNSLQIRLHRNAQWGVWQNAGGALLSAPVPIHFGGALHVFCLLTDGTVRRWSDGAWQSAPAIQISPRLRFAEAPYAFIREKSLVVWATGEDGISTWESVSADGRDFSAWRQIAAGPSDSLSLYINGKGPMILNNQSGSSNAHAAQIVATADASLGIDQSEGKPRQAGMSDGRDRYFVGRYYAVWLDQTGFYGEPNGLWVLNGRPGVELDFVVAPNAEPVTQFIPGELNDGKWGPGYSGSEHIEVPIQKSLGYDVDDGQYGLDEAGYMYGAASSIPWWRSCNGKGTGWNDYFPPFESRKTDDGSGLRMTWEGRFVKVADYTSGNTGRTCGENWPFADGQRRTVYLRLGVELYGNQPIYRRTFQYRNPAGNPGFTTRFNIVTGMVLGFAPAKRLEHDYFFRKIANNPWGDVSRIVGKDIVNCGPSISLSTTGRETYGYSLKSGGCSCHCFAHGGIELGNDFVGAVNNIGGGQTSREGVNTFTLLGAPPDPSGRKYTIAAYAPIPVLPVKRAVLPRPERIGNAMVFPLQGLDAFHARLEIRNASGVLVHAALGDPVWDVSGAPKGIYFYSVRFKKEGRPDLGPGRFLVE